MQSMNSLLKKLRKDFPQFTFVESEEFWWSAKDNTVHIDCGSEHAEAFSLHELSHALLDHRGYSYDIDLIKLERDAWEHAVKTLADGYHIQIDEKLVQDNLDTYRDWLHARSSCPSCETTGLQTKQLSYRCLACGHLWRVNEARVCALRRYSLQIK